MKQCVHCGADFEPRAGGEPQKFCSPSCQRTAYYVANKERYAANGKEWQKANPEKVCAASNKWRKANKERNAANSKAWNEANREYRRKWRESNKERRATTNKAWAEANPEKRNASAAHRRALKSRACPPWADRKAIEAIFEACPADHHVDHISPVKGRHWTGKWEPGDSLLWLLDLPDDAEDIFGNPISTRVSIGLHVPLNLLPIPDEENLSKGNQAPQPGYMDWFGHSLVNGLHPTT